MTITQDHWPAQPFYFGGPKTDSERRFHEALESVKDLIPGKMYRDLSDGAGNRVCEAYDYGLSIGAGQIVPDDCDGMAREEAILVLRRGMERLCGFVEAIDALS